MKTASSIIHRELSGYKKGLTVTELLKHVNVNPNTARKILGGMPVKDKRACRVSKKKRLAYAA